MISSTQRDLETASRQEFRTSVRLFDRNTLWFRCGIALTILLVVGAIILLSLSWPLAELGPLGQGDGSWLVRGLLLLIAVVNGFMLWQQRYLKLFRDHLIGQMDVATRHRVRAEKFYEMSILDPLTGLYNRRFGETRLQEEIDRAEKTGDSLMLVALDFDYFKEINDKYGHAAGDLALKGFARRLQRAIRACDVPIRVGGDEFLVILPECPPDKVDLIFSRIGSFGFTLDGRNVPVSFSRGVARYQVSDSPESLVKRADERLYAEKSKRVHVEV